MARRTATITHIQYRRKWARGDERRAMDVGELPDGGDLLTFAHAVWLSLDPEALMEPEHFLFCRPQPDRVMTVGRSLLCAANVGVYGDPASLRHVNTDAEVRRHDGELTHAVTVRVCLLVPERATSALLFIEHAHEGSLGKPFLRALGDAWQVRYPQWVLDTQTLTRSDAWLEQARLQEVVAEGWGYESDRFDEGNPRRLGKVRSVLRPESGGNLPRSIFEKLRSHEISPRILFGLEHDPEEVKVTLGDGTQRRTFVLGSERTPAVRELLTDHGTRPPTDQGFHDWCLDRAPEHFQPVGVRWDARWNRGDWTPQQLAVTI